MRFASVPGPVVSSLECHPRCS